jgi:RNA polymerase sigma factor (sigma-70 family)
VQAQLHQTDDMTGLVVRIKAGERSAFAALIEHQYDFIFRTAFKWCGQRSDAEDIAQDVCIKLATALIHFDGRSQLRTWLYRIVLNAVRDHQRAGKRRSLRAQAWGYLASDEIKPEQEQALAVQQIWSAVRSLPDQQRDAVLLIYGEDLTHADAARIMGCKETTVSWHVHQARKTLKGLL